MKLIQRPCAWLLAFVLLTNAAGAANSLSDTNSAPLANAGVNRTVVIGETVTLDAGGSTDVDGDRLNFHWILHTPRGSGATLSDAQALRPEFTVDLNGKYTAELVVDDNELNSRSDLVHINTGNVAPTAVIAAPQFFKAENAFALDASESFDANQDVLDFAWSIESAPKGSTASLSGANRSNPMLIADQPGKYTLQLLVADHKLRSKPTFITLDTRAPWLTANAGTHRHTVTRTQLMIGDVQKNAAHLTHHWSILHAPKASSVVLEKADNAVLPFTADVPGHYLLQLITSDDNRTSAPSTVVVTASALQASFGETARGGSDVDGDGVPDDIDNCAEQANPSQLDTNGDGFGNRCDADIDNDGFITNFGDLVLWVASFNTALGDANFNPDADFNGDDRINFVDLFIFQGFFLTAPGPIVNRFINPLGGTWHDPANWSLGVIPNTTHTARIDIGPGVFVTYDTGASEIDTLRSTTELQFSGGVLNINGDMEVNAPVALSGEGSIVGATISTPLTADQYELLANERFTFRDVTLGADLNIQDGGDLRVEDDLILNNAMITLNSDNAFTFIRFIGLSGSTSTLGGTGEIVFNGSTEIDNRNTLEVFNSSDGLVIGPDVTVRTGTSSGRLYHRFTNGFITVQGTIVANLPNRALLIDASDLSVEGNLQVSDSAVMDVLFRNSNGIITSSATLAVDTSGELALRGDWLSNGSIVVTDATLDIANTTTANWDNDGTIELSNAVLELGGSFTVADIGTVTGTGTTNIDGLLDNTGLTLDFAADLPGSLVLPANGGGIIGGTISVTPVAIPDTVSFSFNNLILATDVTIGDGATLTVIDDLILSNNAVVTLASSNGFTDLSFRGVTNGTSVLGGTGEVVFGGTTTLDNRNRIEVFNFSDSLLIDTNVIIRSGTSSGRISHRFNNGAITIDGTVISSLDGRTTNIEANPLIISGSIQASNNAIIDVFFRTSAGVITPSGNLSVDSGAELQLRGNWTNEGTISITDSTLDIGNTLTADWNNNGTIIIDNATVELGGLFTVADIGTITGNGTVAINGVLDNTGMTLDIGTDLPGTTVEFANGGQIVGGTIVNTPITVFATSFTFNNVALSADLTINDGARLFIVDELALVGNPSVLLASANSFTTINMVGTTDGTTLISGTGEILFGGTTTLNNRNRIEVFDSTDSLLIEPGITIRTDTSTGIVSHRFNNGPITLQGTLRSDLTGTNPAVLLDSDALIIEGTLQTANDGVLNVNFRGVGGALTASAVVSVEDNSQMILGGTWVNSGSISATNGTLTLGDDNDDMWSNNGTITLSDAVLELEGSYTVAGIGNVTGTGTTVVGGTLDVSGAPLDIGTDLPGDTVLFGNNGTIANGTITGTELVLQPASRFTLDNVTLEADVTISNQSDLRIIDNLELANNPTITLASTNGFTYLRFEGEASTDTTLTGNGEVVFGGTTTVVNRNRIELFNSMETLTIGPDVTVRTGTAPGSILSRFNNGAVTIQGTVVNNLADSDLLIDATPLVIEGDIQATNTGKIDTFFRNTGGAIASTASLSASTGGEIQLRGNWVSDGAMSATDATLDFGNTATADWDNNGTVSLSNATLELGGNYALADIGTVTGTGTVVIDGVLDNTGNTLDVGTDLPGSTVLFGNNGVIVGGTLAGTPLTVAASSVFSFDNLTLATDVTVENSGDLRVIDDLMLSGGATITLASTNSFTYLRFIGEAGASSTLGGNGEVIFGGTTTIQNRNAVEVFNSGDGLIIDAGVTVRSDTTSGIIDHRFNNGAITLLGTVRSQVPDRAVTMGASPLNLNGTVEVTAGSLINFSTDYSLLSGASLEVEVGGTTTDDYGRLTASTRDVDLDGALNISVVNGFAPSLGETFPIMTFSSLSGTFATENGTNLGGGLDFTVNYNATDVTLEVTN